MENKIVNVKISIKARGSGTTRFWWRVIKNIEEKRYGDEQYVNVKEFEWISRDTREIEIEEGSVLEIFAQHSGGWRCASVRHFFVVKEGEEDELSDKSGTREIVLKTINLRRMRKEEVFEKFGFKKNNLGFWQKNEKECKEEMEKNIEKVI